MTLNKNLWVIPTDDKYSRLYFNINDKEFQICEIEKPSTILKPNRHIYITSDEKIKEGDWFYCPTTDIVNQCESDYHSKKLIKPKRFKIILTTDPRLAPDVQKIDDEFLEWFVKNPSCEEVEVKKEKIRVDKDFNDISHWNRFVHKIIIPKEELTKDEIDRFFVDMICNTKEPKQETLEEFAERLYPIILEDDGWDKNKQYRDEWIEGAKWQQEYGDWKIVEEETPPSNIELLVQSPEGVNHLSSWRDAYNIFACQSKSESSLGWKWKTI